LYEVWTVFSCYFCPDSSCHFSLCLRCFLLAKYPSESLNFPQPKEYGLPLPGATCAASLPHRPDVGAPDLSFVLIPAISVNITGWGTEEKGQLAAARIVKEDVSLNAGLGFYPYQIVHTKNLLPPGAAKKVRDVARAFCTVHAERLIIQISAHMGAHREGYTVGDYPYGESVDSDVHPPADSSFPRVSFGWS
jgi:hypothetical protein